MGCIFLSLTTWYRASLAYAKIVSSAGTRNNITNQILQEAGIQDKKSEIILSGINRSKGGEITSDSLKLVRKLADQVIEQSLLRDDLATILRHLWK